jgi:hypothetical protein
MTPNEPLNPLLTKNAKDAVSCVPQIVGYLGKSQDQLWIASLSCRCS